MVQIDVASPLQRAIALHKAGQFAEAEVLYKSVLATDARNANALRLLGALMLQSGRHEDALDWLAAALEVNPRQSEALNSRAVVLQELKRHDEAIAACDAAIAVKPEYAIAHYNRAVSLKELGRIEEALASYDQAVALKPAYPEALHNRGILLHKQRRFPEALHSVRQALAIKPDYAAAWCTQGIILADLQPQDPDAALESFERAIVLKPDYAEAYVFRGLTLQDLQRYTDALTSYDKAIAFKPEYAEAYHYRADALASLGRMEEAKTAFRQALQTKPGLASAWYGLTGIHKYNSIKHSDVAKMQALYQRADCPPADKDYLGFALGKIYDDCKQYDQAFTYFTEANRIRNEAAGYDRAVVAERTDALIAAFSKELLAMPLLQEVGNPAPIFIVGMPRSGTTLLASILARHPQVASAGELPTIAHCIDQLSGQRIQFPEQIAHLNREMATALREEYLKRLQRDIDKNVVYIVDKNPLNFRNLGFMVQLFPSARIIHCTRDAMDTCLSNYFQRFALEYNFSFDLDNLAHYYREYVRLMQHWQRVLLLPMLTVRYEDTVSDTEKTTRALLAYLQLEWDERCLSPQANTQGIDTASRWQVRQPVYQQSVARWRHYEAHLAPLKSALREAGIQASALE